jgi:hypothetical protein
MDGSLRGPRALGCAKTPTCGRPRQGAARFGLCQDAHLSTPVHAAAAVSTRVNLFLSLPPSLLPFIPHYQPAFQQTCFPTNPCIASHSLTLISLTHNHCTGGGHGAGGEALQGAGVRGGQLRKLRRVLPAALCGVPWALRDCGGASARVRRGCKRCKHPRRHRGAHTHTHVYVHVFTYVYTYVCIYVCTHTHADVCICIPAHTYVCIYTYIHICIYTYDKSTASPRCTHTHTHTHTCICTCIYVCIYVRMYIRTYAYTYVPTHTQMYVYTYPHKHRCMYIHAYTYIHTYRCTYACVYTCTDTYVNKNNCHVTLYIHTHRCTSRPSAGTRARLWRWSSVAMLIPARVVWEVIYEQ